jgi:hypothetical protein
VNLLSDIVNSDGTTICKEYITFPTSDIPPHHPERRTTLLWPRQGKPSARSFPYWKLHIFTLANSDQQGKLRKRLGPWFTKDLSLDNKWSSYYHPTTGLYINDNEHFRIYKARSVKRCTGVFSISDQITEFPPTDAFPIKTSVSGSTAKITVSSFATSNHTTNTTSPSDFNSYIDSRPQWEQRLLSMWWTVELPDLLQFLRHEAQIIMVSDGGCKPPKGSYGGVIGTSTKSQKATIEGFVKGGYSTLTSFRCEAYGMLASFLFMKTMCQHFKVQGQQRLINYFCDGQSLLKRISYSRFNKLKHKDTLKEDFDIELQILQEIHSLEKLGFRITIHFVKGHQKISEDSPVSAVYNQVADQLASQNLHSHNTWLPYDLLPTMKVITTYNKVLITGSIKSTVRNMVLFPSFYDTTCKHISNSKKLTSTLWWAIPKKTLPRFSRSDRFRIIKFNFELLHTKVSEHKIDPEVSPICPHCNNHPETADHVVTCIKYQVPRQVMLDNLFKRMQSSMKNNAINECIYTAVCAHINGTVCPDITSFIDKPSEYLTDAYKQQTAIGWSNFCKGRWSSLWEPLFNHEIRKYPNQSKLTAQKWACDIQFDIWSGMLECWSTRNGLIHGNLTHQQQTYKRHKLLKEVNTYIQKHMKDQVTISISTFENKPLSWIVNWLRHQRGKDLLEQSQNSVVSLP